MEIFYIFVFIVPILLGFFEILFFRKCVTSPRIPRISWLGFLMFCIPVIGAVLAYIILGVIIVMCSTEDIELDENRKFVKKWLKS